MAEFTRTTATTARDVLPVPDMFDRLRQRLQECQRKFQARSATPPSCYAFEKEVKTVLDEAGRELMEETLGCLESADRTQAASRVRYHKETYRINKRTKATIATSFGPITLWSFLYLNEEAGEPGLHPLHVQLGIVAGASPVLAE